MTNATPILGPVSTHPVSFGDRLTLEEWAALDEDEPGVRAEVDARRGHRVRAS